MLGSVLRPVLGSTGRAQLRVRPDDPRQPKVGQLGHAAARHQHVGRLDVAVDDGRRPAVMEVGEGAADVDADGDLVPLAHAAPLRPVHLQVAHRQEFHHDHEWRVHKAEELHDIRVAASHHQLELAEEELLLRLANVPMRHLGGHRRPSPKQLAHRAEPTRTQQVGRVLLEALQIGGQNLLLIQQPRDANRVGFGVPSRHLERSGGVTQRDRKLLLGWASGPLP